MPDCRQCHTSFAVTDHNREFYGKMEVLEPTLCPQCSWQRQLAFRNEKSLYFRACNLCKQQTLSMYPADTGYTVYCVPCWKSDQWDPLRYSISYDPQKTFFEQYDALLHAVPRPALFHIGENTHCEYANYLYKSSHVYFSFSVPESEYVYYSRNIDHSKDIVDCINCDQCELMYESINCDRCYKSIGLQDCEECLSCFFCYDCVNCRDCFGSVNLRHKRFCWLNEQLTESEYKKRCEDWQASVPEAIEHIEKSFRRRARIMRSENSSGDYLRSCKNVKNCFYGWGGEDCGGLFRFVGPIKDAARSAYIGINSERIYNCMAANRSNTLLCSIFSSLNMNCAYLNHCESCSDCFGSTALKHKKFCILNRQYSEEEYHSLQKKIIADMKKRGEYGEFFPPHLSEFSYNETLASEFFPLSKEEALRQGFKWQDDLPFTTGKETVQLAQVPGNIAEVDENITKEVLACALCKKNYKITPHELGFYKKLGIPIPHHCFECRLKARIAMLNPVKLWTRICMREGCKNQFETNYAPDRPEIIYCDSCYKNAVY